MKNRFKFMKTPLLVVAIASLALSASAVLVQAANVKNGEAEFKEHCASCHADGGNIIKPAKTLSTKDREVNGIKTAKDIITLMRKPGEGMTTFDKKTISEKEAKDIAAYILKSFK